MRVHVTHSTRGELCGIRQYATQLDRSFQKLGVEVVVHDYDHLPQTVASGDVALFHYEPSLITAPLPFQECLKRVRQMGGKIVLCCHWYRHSDTTKYDGIVDRYVLHRTYPDAGAQSVVISLGAPLYDVPEDRAALRARLNLPADKFVLVTVGFLAEWKRVPDVVEKLASCVPDGVVIRVQTPIPFSAAGRPSYGQDITLRKVAEKFPGKVTVSTDFLPERDLLDLVYASDLGFVYHPEDTGSVSAATKQFVSARTPVVVTGSSHSADMVRGVRRVGSFDAGAFAAEVIRIASDQELLQKLRRGIQQEYERINMDVVARRYVEEFRLMGAAP